MRQSLPKLARNAFQVLVSLPRHGVGSSITRKTWRDDSFWTVTEIKTGLDGKTGKAYGMLTWRGEQQSDRPKKINGTLKKVWKLRQAADQGIHRPQRGTSEQAWPSLVASALKTESAVEHEREQQAAGGSSESTPESHIPQAQLVNGEEKGQA